MLCKTSEGTWSKDTKTQNAWISFCNPWSWSINLQFSTWREKKIRHAFLRCLHMNNIGFCRCLVFIVLLNEWHAFLINVNISTKIVELQFKLLLLCTGYNAVNSVHANEDGCAFLVLDMKTKECKWRLCAPFLYNLNEKQAFCKILLYHLHIWIMLII